MRKVKVTSPTTIQESNDMSTINDESMKKPIIRKAPQPAPRLSINKNLPGNCDENANNVNGDDTKSDRNLSMTSSSSSSNHNRSSVIYANGDTIHNDDILDSSKGSMIACSGTPPPLPPKPKIKPSNWSNTGRNGSMERNKNIPLKHQTLIDGKIPAPRTVYLDQPNSSFV